MILYRSDTEGVACSVCRHMSSTVDDDGVQVNYCECHGGGRLHGDVDSLMCDYFEPRWPEEVGL